MTKLLDDLAEVVRIRNLRIEAARLGNDVDWNDLHDEFEHVSDRFFHDHAAEIERNARDAELLAEAERLVTKAIGKHGVQFEIQFAPLVVNDGTLREYLMHAIDTAMREGGGE